MAGIKGKSGRKKGTDNKVTIRLYIPKSVIAVHGGNKKIKEYILQQLQTK